eukprot:6491656-Amphidinium_carterae.3
MGAKALGSGCSGEVEKAAALTHMLAMLRPHMSDLKRHVCEVRAVCTDLGTESGLANMHTPVENLVPPWYGALSIGLEADVMDVEGVSTQSGLQPDIEHFGGATADRPALEHFTPTTAKGFLPLAIGVAGMEHITNNLTEEIHVHLAYWETFYGQLKNASLLLVHRFRRERFVQHCLGGSPLAQQAHELEGWSATLYEKRWRHVILFIRALLPVWPLLKAFSAHRYLNAGGGGEIDVMGGAQFDAVQLEATVNDTMFYIYARFAAELDGVPNTLAEWSKGCPCHSVLRKSKSTTQTDRAFRVHLGATGLCRLQGKRAPELAAGMVPQMLVEAVDMVVWDLLLAGAALSPDQLSVLMADKTAALGHLRLQLSVKLDFWRRVPWVLCGVAHWSETVARSCARDAVAAISKQAKESFDVVTQRWAAPPLWDDLQSFASGMAFSDTSQFFQEEIAALFFTPVNETCIEAKHARATKAVSSATNAGAVTVSLANRWPAVHHLFTQDLHMADSPQAALLRKASMDSLLDAFRVARSTRLAVTKLGLQHHPLVTKALARMDEWKELRKVHKSGPRAPGGHALVQLLDNNDVCLGMANFTRLSSTCHNVIFTHRKAEEAIKGRSHTSKIFVRF